MSIRWSLLSSLKVVARSSHCATITPAGQLLLYSGELTPRVPVKGSVHVLDLGTNNASWRVLSAVPAAALSDVPQPRVGASAVFDPKENSLYVWGGRGGVDMAPLDRLQSGIWKAHIGDANLQSDGNLSWERVPCANEGGQEAPAPRSYHASVLAGGKLYIHAGCPACGRLAALHAFNFTSNKWEQCADAPNEPRGGTAIAAVTLPSTSTAHEEVIIRFGGFAGYELPKLDDTDALPPLDIYIPSTNSWTIVHPAADSAHKFPGPRSVHGLVPFTIPASAASSLGGTKVPIALLYYGERDASALGHAGAGKFWDDVWLLLASPSANPASAELQWKKLEVKGESPTPRGWFPPASYVTSEGKTRVVLTGGLLGTNDRSQEVWVGDVEL
ncbi:galactose oxidase [Phlebopus sp. FC_14]|nr:galactose oxidase [Phlebopus sp. FC_14]